MKFKFWYLLVLGAVLLATQLNSNMMSTVGIDKDFTYDHHFVRNPDFDDDIELNTEPEWIPVKPLTSGDVFSFSAGIPKFNCFDEFPAFETDSKSYDVTYDYGTPTEHRETVTESNTHDVTNCVHNTREDCWELPVYLNGVTTVYHPQDEITLSDNFRIVFSKLSACYDGYELQMSPHALFDFYINEQDGLKIDFLDSTNLIKFNQPYNSTVNVQNSIYNLQGGVMKKINSGLFFTATGGDLTKRVLFQGSNKFSVNIPTHEIGDVTIDIYPFIEFSNGVSLWSWTNTDSKGFRIAPTGNTDFKLITITRHWPSMVNLTGVQSIPVKSEPIANVGALLIAIGALGSAIVYIKARR